MDENALIVDGLCTKQGKFELHDISFRLPKGYIMGLVGRMGSGKTTLLKNILNPALIKSGSVRYDVQAGFIMEDAPFFIEATLKENMEVFKNLYKNYDEQEFYDRLKSVGLEEHKVYGLLSKGEKVRFQFAFAMGHHPGLLLLDEPTSGLDVSFCREFLYMIQEAVEKQLVSVIFSTHLTDELERIADFIGVMENGTLQIEQNEVSDANIEKTDTDDYKPLLGDMPVFKELVSFCRGIYLKSNLRFVSYIIVFFQFIFGSAAFLIDSETQLAAGFMSGLVVMGIMLQYLGLVTQKGDETGRRAVPMRVGRFWCLNRWTLWGARMFCILRSSLCFAVIALVQSSVAAVVTGNGGCMLAVLGIAVDYVVVALLTAIVTLIVR